MKKARNVAYHAEQPPDVILIERPLKTKSRPFCSWLDAKIVVQLPIWLAVAWLLPEQTWERISLYLSSLHFGRSRDDDDSLVTKIRAVQPKLPVPRTAAAIASNLRRGQIELYLQILRALRPGGWTPDIKIVGDNNLTAALREGKGAVLWVSHFVFNSMATKIALDRLDLESWHVSRPEHGFSKTQFGIRCLNPLRVAAESHYLAGRIVIDRLGPGAAMRTAYKLLAKNKIVSITAGAWEGNRIAVGEFLGGEIELAVGAPGLALASGARLIPVFTYRHSEDSSITVLFDPHIPLNPQVNRDEELLRVVRNYLDRLYPHVLRYPDQWRGLSSLKVTR